MFHFRTFLIATVLISIVGTSLEAQPPRNRRRPPWYIEPTPETLRKVEDLIEEVRDVEVTINVRPNISRLIKTKRPITRISITDPSVMDVIQYNPTEFELIGLRRGVTSMSIWYAKAESDLESTDSSPPVAPRRAVAFRR